MDHSKFKADDKFALQTRILNCPDSVGRVVTMEYWFWYHHDWLAENNIVPHAQWITEVAYWGALQDIADNPEIEIDPEEQFRAILYEFIIQKMQSVEPSYKIVINSNRPLK